jgi:hypothetical protein
LRQWRAVRRGHGTGQVHVRPVRPNGCMMIWLSRFWREAQCRLRHSSRNFPLKLSMYALSTGLPALRADKLKTEGSSQKLGPTDVPRCVLGLVLLDGRGGRGLGGRGNDLAT